MTPSTKLGRAQLALGIVASVIVVALGARFALYAGGLWRDEVHTVHLASKSWSGLVALLDRDSAPLLFVSLVKLWTTPEWPDEDAAIRLLGFLFTAGMVGVLWISARVLRLGPPLLSLTLFAAQGVVIQTVSSAKSYGFSSLPALGAFAAILKLVEQPSRGAFAVAVALSVLTAQTSYSTVPIVITIAAVAVSFTMWTDWRRAALIAVVPVVTVLSLLPYAGIIARSRSWRPLTESDLPLHWVIDLVFRVAASSSPWIVGIWVVAFVAAAYAAVRQAGMVAAGDASARRAVCGVVAGTAAFVTFLVFMTMVGRPPQPWHWAPALGVLAFGMDVALARTAPFAWTRVALAIVAALVVLPVAVPRVSTRQTNVDQIARYLEGTADRRDLIVVNPWYVGITFARYYRGQAPWITVPPMADIVTHRYDLLKEQLMSSSPLAPLHEDIVKTLKSGNRVWLVGGLQFLPKGEVPPTLAPAPNGPLGWKDAPYRIVWSIQTGYLVQNSALNWRIVTPTSDRPVEPVENAPLIVVEGWRN